MAKRVILAGLIIFLLTAAFAAPGYCDDPIKKLGRGIANIGTCFFEIFIQAARVDDTDGPWAAATWGVLKGTGMTFTRLLVGVYETVTFPFPIPKDYAPILTDPEFMFEEQNW